MKKIKKHKYLIIFLIVITFVLIKSFTFLFYFEKKEPFSAEALIVKNIDKKLVVNDKKVPAIINKINGNTQKPKNVEKPLNDKVFSIEIIAGDAVIHPSINRKETLFEVLDKSLKSDIIYMKGTDYPALGFFVTDIGTLHAGNGKNLIYYINNKEASVGVSSYFPQNGDIINWKLE